MGLQRTSGGQVTLQCDGNGCGRIFHTLNLAANRSFWDALCTARWTHEAYKRWFCPRCSKFK